jgi:hypothetical protein
VLHLRPTLQAPVRGEIQQRAARAGAEGLEQVAVDGDAREIAIEAGGGDPGRLAVQGQTPVRRAAQTEWCRRQHLAAGGELHAVQHSGARVHADALRVQGALTAHVIEVDLLARRRLDPQARDVHGVALDRHQRRQEMRLPGAWPPGPRPHLDQRAADVRMAHAQPLPGERQHGEAHTHRPGLHAHAPVLHDHVLDARAAAEVARHPADLERDRSEAPAQRVRERAQAGLRAIR